MKVLGLAGSPRRHGNTDILLEKFMQGAAAKGAEIKTLIVCNLKVSGCIHCDACLEKGICIIKDDMQMIYKEMESADRIVVTSPVQFMGISAQMKAVIDRCQALWARKYVLKIPPLGDTRPRKGYFISVSGRRTVPNLFDGEMLTIKNFFKMIDVPLVGELLVPGVDAKGDIMQHQDALDQAYQAGQNIMEP